MKNVGLRIRVERNLREAFVTACQQEDQVASQVLREFMQAYVERYQQGQDSLFAETSLQPVPSNNNNKR